MPRVAPTSTDSVCWISDPLVQSFPERHSNAPKHGWGEFKAQTLQRQLGGSHSSSVSQEHLPFPSAILSYHTKNLVPNEGKQQHFPGTRKTSL